MTNTLRAAIKALMNKFSTSSMVEDLTIVQAIDSNDEQIQENTASISTIQSALPTYVYKAVINQSGVNAPSEDAVIVNTFPGAINITYDNVGSYLVSFDDVDLSSFLVNTIQDCVSDTGTIGGLVGYVYGSQSGGNYQIQTANAALSQADDILVNYTLVIEAYSA